MKEFWKETKYWWLIAIGMIYPVFMTDKYFNITQTKVVTFEVMVVFFTIAALYDEFQLGTRKRAWTMGNRADALVLVFLLVNILSTITSDSWRYTLFAEKDKNMGLYFMFMLVCTYLIMRLEVWDMVRLCRILEVGVAFVTLFSLIQYLGFDLFDLFDGIRSDVVINFISPLGNTAIYGRFLILTYPVILAEQVFSQEKSHWVELLAAMLFGPAVLAANVDAAWLGFGIVVWCFAVGAGKQLSTWTRCIRLYACICTGLGIWGILYKCMKHPRNTSRIAGFFIAHWYLELLAAVVLFGIYVWLKKKEERSLSIGKIALVAGIVLFVCTAAVVLYFSVWDRKTPLGGLENYIRFSKSWGTDRGYIWDWCMKLYRNFSWKEKLFGKGQGMVPVLLSDYYMKEMRNTIGYVFDNAHNLYLHLLLNTGVCGVISYISVIVYSMLMSTRKKNYYGAGIALFACAWMDLVCICEPITMPFTWIWIGLIASRTCK